jgi:hypothetical protein
LCFNLSPDACDDYNQKLMLRKEPWRARSPLVDRSAALEDGTSRLQPSLRSWEARQNFIVRLIAPQTRTRSVVAARILPQGHPHSGAAKGHAFRAGRAPHPPI